MSYASENGWRRLVAPGIGLVLFIFGTVVLFGSFSDGDIVGLLAGAGILGIAGRLLAPVVAGAMAERATNLLYAGDKLSRPAPAYSVPKARRVFGEYDAAIEELRKIVLEHPGEIEAWTEMVDIALVDLKDRDRAMAIFREALGMLPTPEAKAAFNRSFEAMMNRFKRRQAEDAREPPPRIKLPPEPPPE